MAALGRQGNLAALSSYELRNLVPHLQAAGRHDDLHKVLALSTAEGTNAWYEAHLGLGDTARYLDDIQRAWSAAEAAVEQRVATSPLCAEVGLQARYALISATLGSLAQSVPTELVVVALRHGFWSARRALSFVRQLRDPAARAAALAAIAPHCDEFGDEVAGEVVAAVSAAAVVRAPPPELFASLPDALAAPMIEQVAAAAGTVNDPGARAVALTAVAQRFRGPQQLAALHEALGAARAAEDGRPRMDAFAALYPVLPEALRLESEVLAALRSRGVPDSPAARLAALKSVAPHLSEDGLAEAFKIARSFSDWQTRVQATLELVPRLPQPRLHDALQRAGKARATRERARLLAGFAPRLRGSERRELEAEALAVARKIPRHNGRAAALAAVAKCLPRSRRGAIVGEALAALDPQDLASPPEEVLVELAPDLGGHHVPVALELARRIDEAGPRLEAICALLDRVPARQRGAVLRSALTAARAEHWPLFRVQALARILPHLAPATRERVAREALEVTASIEAGWFRTKALAALSPHLPPVLIPDALRVTATLEDRGPRSLLLASLATPAAASLEPDVTADALAVTGRRSNHHERVPVLALLAPHLNSEQLEEALRLLTPEDPLDGGHAEAAAEGLQVLATYLPESLLAAAIEIAEGIGYLHERAQALAALSPRLTGTLIERALAVARAIPPTAHADGRHGGGRHHRAEALVAIATRLPEPARHAVLDEALATARAIHWAQDRAATFVELAPDLPNGLRTQAVEEALDALAEADMPDDHVARLLGLLAPFFEGQMQRRALEAAHALGEDEARGRALLALAAFLPEPARGGAVCEAVSAARSIYAVDETDRLRKLALLVAVAEQLPAASRAKLIDEAHTAAQELEYPSQGEYPSQDDTPLARLLPHLSPQDRDALLARALSSVRGIAAEGARHQLLLQLVPLLTPPVQLEVMREALALGLRAAPDLDRLVRIDLPRLTNLPRNALHEVWRRTLHALSGDDRAALLHRLSDLVPLVSTLGGQPAAAAERAAVLEVTGWWP
jgi:hypothetical protein